jgi:hypothetical protein
MNNANVANHANIADHPPSLSGARLILAASVLALVLSVVAQLIGTYKIKLGASAIVLFPIIWVVLIAGFVSIQKFRPLSKPIQDISMSLMMIGITIFLTRLGMLIGPSLDEIKKAGAARKSATSSEPSFLRCPWALPWGSGALP